MNEHPIFTDAELAEEEWRDYHGWVGTYQVSNLGRVRSLDRVVLTKANVKVPHKGRILKPCDNSRNHLFVNLGTDCIGKTVSRMVASTFIPNPNGKPQVNHKNGNTYDNRLANLEWVTNSENMFHSCRVLGKKRFEDHNQAKLTREIVEDMKILRAFGATFSALASAYCVSRKAASSAVNGKTWVALPYSEISG